MGRSSSRSSSIEDKKKRKRDEKKKKKSRSRSAKKDSKRKRSISRDKKKKRSSNSIDHKKKKSRSRDRKKRSHSKDRKRKQDRSSSRRRHVSKDRGSSNEKQAENKQQQQQQPVAEMTEEQKKQFEIQKQRERLARMKMLKFQSLSDSDEEDDDIAKKINSNNKNNSQASNIPPIVVKEIQEQHQQKELPIQFIPDNSQMHLESNDGQLPKPSIQEEEEDLLLVQIQQQIAVQAKLQNTHTSPPFQNHTSPSSNYALPLPKTQYGTIGDEDEIILEKSDDFNKSSMRYVEDFLYSIDDNIENQFDRGQQEQQNASLMDQEDVAKQLYNDSDGLEGSDDEELNQNIKIGNDNNSFYSEKLQKLQMMNQQETDVDEFEGVFGTNKQSKSNIINTNNITHPLSQSLVNATNNGLNSRMEITKSTTMTQELSQKSMNTSIFTNNKTINQQWPKKEEEQVEVEEEDAESDESDLDVFMRQLEQQEEKPNQNGANQGLNKGEVQVPKQNYITMEEILGKKVLKDEEQFEEEFGDDQSQNLMTDEVQQKQNGIDQDDEEDDKEDEEFHRAFKEQMRKIKEEKLKDNTGALMMDEEQEEEEVREAVQDPENGESKEDYMDRLKREAMKKELKPVEYKDEDLESFQKNFYIESKEITQMTEEEVKTYRDNLGEISAKGTEVPRPIKSWLQSGLSDRILDVLINKKKYDKPFPVQCQSLPVIMSGRDMIGIAETGSGKTLAYILPMIRHVSAQRPLEEGDGPIGIILVPTRELATQIYQEAKPFLKPYKYEIVAVYGGTGIKGQLSELKRGCEIVVATPGRLIDVLTTSNGKITNLKRVTMVVIDEADRMFDLGFEPQIAKILATTRPDKQTALFSATFPKNVENLAKKLMRHKPCEISVGARGQACTNITQIIEIREEATRLYRLLELLGNFTEQGQVIIFVDKQFEVDQLYKELRSKYYLPTILHAGVDAEDRTSNLQDFRKGIYKILIATSVSSRGIDVKNVVLVVNYKCPNHIEDYIHRIGRTGRAGNKGTAVTFLSPDEDKYSLDLIKALKRSDQRVPDELMRMGEEFKKKVKSGEAKIYNNVNMQGKGFSFDEDEKDKQNQQKYEQKKFLALQMGLDIEEQEEDDIFKKKALEEGSGKEKKDKKDDLTFQQKLHIIKVQDEYKELRDELFSESIKVANQKKQQGLGDVEIQKAIEEIYKKGLEDFIPSTKNVEIGKIKIAKMLKEFEKTNEEANNLIVAELEINDYPENARKAVTKRDFIDRIYCQTGCIITQKGILVETGKKVQPGFQKLYLRIEGDSEHQVRMAYKDMKQELEEKSIKVHERGIQTGRFVIA